MNKPPANALLARRAGDVIEESDRNASDTEFGVVTYDFRYLTTFRRYRYDDCYEWKRAWLSMQHLLEVMIVVRHARLLSS